MEVKAGELVKIGVDCVGVIKVVEVDVKGGVSVGSMTGAECVSVGSDAGAETVGAAAGSNDVVEHATTSKARIERIR